MRAAVGIVWRLYRLAKLLQKFPPIPLVASCSLLSLTQELGASSRCPYQLMGYHVTCAIHIQGAVAVFTVRKC